MKPITVHKIVTDEQHSLVILLCSSSSSSTSNRFWLTILKQEEHFGGLKQQQDQQGKDNDTFSSSAITIDLPQSIISSSSSASSIVDLVHVVAPSTQQRQDDQREENENINNKNSSFLLLTLKSTSASGLSTFKNIELTLKLCSGGEKKIELDWRTIPYTNSFSKWIPGCYSSSFAKSSSNFLLACSSSSLMKMNTSNKSSSSSSTALHFVEFFHPVERNGIQVDTKVRLVQNTKPTDDDHSHLLFDWCSEFMIYSSTSLRNEFILHPIVVPADGGVKVFSPQSAATTSICVGEDDVIIDLKILSHDNNSNSNNKTTQQQHTKKYPSILALVRNEKTSLFRLVILNVLQNENCHPIPGEGEEELLWAETVESIMLLSSASAVSPVNTNQDRATSTSLLTKGRIQRSGNSIVTLLYSEWNSVLLSVDLQTGQQRIIYDELRNNQLSLMNNGKHHHQKKIDPTRDIVVLSSPFVILTRSKGEDDDVLVFDEALNTNNNTDDHSSPSSVMSSASPSPMNSPSKNNKNDDNNSGSSSSSSSSASSSFAEYSSSSSSSFSSNSSFYRHHQRQPRILQSFRPPSSSSRENCIMSSSTCGKYVAVLNRQNKKLDLFSIFPSCHHHQQQQSNNMKLITHLISSCDIDIASSLNSHKQQQQSMFVFSLKKYNLVRIVLYSIDSDHDLQKSSSSSCFIFESTIDSSSSSSSSVMNCVFKQQQQQANHQPFHYYYFDSNMNMLASLNHRNYQLQLVDCTAKTLANTRSFSTTDKKANQSDDEENVLSFSCQSTSSSFFVLRTLTQHQKKELFVSTFIVRNNNDDSESRLVSTNKLGTSSSSFSSSSPRRSVSSQFSPSCPWIFFLRTTNDEISLFSTDSPSYPLHHYYPNNASSSSSSSSSDLDCVFISGNHQGLKYSTDLLIFDGEHGSGSGISVLSPSSSSSLTNISVDNNNNDSSSFFDKCALASSAKSVIFDHHVSNSFLVLTPTSSTTSSSKSSLLLLEPTISLSLNRKLLPPKREFDSSNLMQMLLFEFCSNSVTKTTSSSTSSSAKEETRSTKLLKRFTTYQNALMNEMIESNTTDVLTLWKMISKTTMKNNKMIDETGGGENEQEEENVKKKKIEEREKKMKELATLSYPQNLLFEDLEKLRSSQKILSVCSSSTLFDALDGAGKCFLAHWEKRNLSLFDENQQQQKEGNTDDNDEQRYFSKIHHPLPDSAFCWAMISDAQDVLINQVLNKFISDEMMEKCSAFILQKQKVAKENSPNDKNHMHVLGNFCADFIEHQVCLSGVGLWASKTGTYLKQVAEVTSKKILSVCKDPRRVACWYVAQNKLERLSVLCLNSQEPRLAAFFKRDFSKPENQKAATDNAFAALGKGMITLAVAFYLLARQPEQALRILLLRGPFSKESSWMLGALLIRLWSVTWEPDFRMLEQESKSSSYQQQQNDASSANHRQRNLLLGGGDSDEDESSTQVVIFDASKFSEQTMKQMIATVTKEYFQTHYNNNNNNNNNSSLSSSLPPPLSCWIHGALDWLNGNHVDAIMKSVLMMMVDDITSSSHSSSSNKDKTTNISMMSKNPNSLRFFERFLLVEYTLAHSVFLHGYSTSDRTSCREVSARLELFTSATNQLLQQGHDEVLEEIYSNKNNQNNNGSSTSNSEFSLEAIQHNLLHSITKVREQIIVNNKKKEEDSKNNNNQNQKQTVTSSSSTAAVQSGMLDMNAFGNSDDDDDDDDDAWMLKAVSQQQTQQPETQTQQQKSIVSTTTTSSIPKQPQQKQQQPSSSASVRPPPPPKNTEMAVQSGMLDMSAFGNSDDDDDDDESWMLQTVNNNNNNNQQQQQQQEQHVDPTTTHDEEKAEESEQDADQVEKDIKFWMNEYYCCYPQNQRTNQKMRNPRIVDEFNQETTTTTTTEDCALDIFRGSSEIGLSKSLLALSSSSSSTTSSTANSSGPVSQLEHTACVWTALALDAIDRRDSLSILSMLFPSTSQQQQHQQQDKYDREKLLTRNILEVIEENKKQLKSEWDMIEHLGAAGKKYYQNNDEEKEEDTGNNNNKKQQNEDSSLNWTVLAGFCFLTFQYWTNERIIPSVSSSTTTLLLTITLLKKFISLFASDHSLSSLRWRLLPQEDQPLRISQRAAICDVLTRKLEEQLLLNFGSQNTASLQQKQLLILKSVCPLELLTEFGEVRNAKKTNTNISSTSASSSATSSTILIPFNNNSNKNNSNNDFLSTLIRTPVDSIRSRFHSTSEIVKKFFDDVENDKNKNNLSSSSNRIFILHPEIAAFSWQLLDLVAVAIARRGSSSSSSSLLHPSRPGLISRCAQNERLVSNESGAVVPCLSDASFVSATSATSNNSSRSSGRGSSSSSLTFEGGFLMLTNLIKNPSSNNRSAFVTLQHDTMLDGHYLHRQKQQQQNSSSSSTSDFIAEWTLELPLDPNASLEQQTSILDLSILHSSQERSYIDKNKNKNHAHHHHRRSRFTTRTVLIISVTTSSMISIYRITNQQEQREHDHNNTNNDKTILAPIRTFSFEEMKKAAKLQQYQQQQNFNNNNNNNNHQFTSVDPSSLLYMKESSTFIIVATNSKTHERFLIVWSFDCSLQTKQQQQQQNHSSSSSSLLFRVVHRPAPTFEFYSSSSITPIRSFSSPTSMIASIASRTITSSVPQQQNTKNNNNKTSPTTETRVFALSLSLAPVFNETVSTLLPLPPHWFSNQQPQKQKTKQTEEQFSIIDFTPGFLSSSSNSASLSYIGVFNHSNHEIWIAACKMIDTTSIQQSKSIPSQCLHACWCHCVKLKMENHLDHYHHQQFASIALSFEYRVLAIALKTDDVFFYALDDILSPLMKATKTGNFSSLFLPSIFGLSSALFSSNQHHSKFYERYETVVKYGQKKKEAEDAGLIFTAAATKDNKMSTSPSMKTMTAVDAEDEERNTTTIAWWMKRNREIQSYQNITMVNSQADLVENEKHIYERLLHSINNNNNNNNSNSSRNNSSSSSIIESTGAARLEGSSSIGGQISKIFFFDGQVTVSSSSSSSSSSAKGSFGSVHFTDEEDEEDDHDDNNKNKKKRQKTIQVPGLVGLVKPNADQQGGMVFASFLSLQ